MSVHPHPERGPAPQVGDHNPQGGRDAADTHEAQAGGADRERLRQVHADPEQINAEAREQAARRGSVEDAVNDPGHYRLRPEQRAHGTHGKGFSDEARVDDEQAVDTGDDPQLRTAGGGGDQAPDPNRFRENSEGRMGGPGWGNEQAGGSSVDRRPRDGGA